MVVFYILIFVVIVIVVIVIYVFFWVVDSGQYDDFDGFVYSIFFDDEDLKYQVGVDEVEKLLKFED